ncbi:MAG: hypothetical protein EXS17_00500 [Phycisphaerales bacterium]|nr:hypothetical protein [Phycisphaerales bacterium]
MNTTLSRVLPSKQLRPAQPSQQERVNGLRRAYFATAAAHARWRIDIEAVIAQVESTVAPAAPWRLPPSEWIEDVVIARACIQGEQQAWHHVQLANTWRLREVAELRLTPSQASLLVERFWRNLHVRSRAQNNSAGLHTYHGGETLSRWLLSQVLAQVESLPVGGSIDASVDAILDTMPQLRTLACEASESTRVPQAT